MFDISFCLKLTFCRWVEVDLYLFYYTARETNRTISVIAQDVAKLVVY